MKDAIKSILPVNVRTRLKWAGYAVKDIIDPVKDPRVPNRRDTFVGGGDFVAVGDDFLKTLKRHGVTTDMAILDVGCGQGRMARPLTEFLVPEGRYLGFDIVKAGVEWCQTHYDDLPNFTFVHADVFNARYNADGKTEASAYTFPSDSDAYDFAFLTSVFTHMFQKDVERYLSEITRSLKPGGRCLITWFLMNPQTEACKAPRLTFRFPVDEVSKTTLEDNPEAAIAFSENWVREAYLKNGLAIEAIEYGNWANPHSQFGYQDTIIARKV